MISASDARRLVEEGNKRRKLLGDIESEVRRAAIEGLYTVDYGCRLPCEKDFETIRNILENTYGYIIYNVDRKYMDALYMPEDDYDLFSVSFTISWRE